jgi:hypothetical protein
MGYGNSNIVAIIAVHLFVPLNSRLVDNVFGGGDQLFVTFVQRLRELHTVHQHGVLSLVVVVVVAIV